ncbi:MAG: hypothetical protein K6E85_04135 [Lachnospiraceae bacterium]|nr:hypothetical protein [Lachnospiraceae bacterium]
MVKMTSAYANKALKRLYDDKAFLISGENDGITYVATTTEEPVIPDYDYVKTAEKIAAIDEKIIKIKHAINLANVTNTVQIGDETLTIDMVLVKMAQLNSRLGTLDRMRKLQPKSRVDAYYSSNTVSPEYKYINFDKELVMKDYDEMNSYIAQMQLALDKYNQTVEFDVDIVW